MLCSDFLSDLYLLRYNSLIWISAVGCVHIPRLFWIRHFERFWGLKNYSMTKTDILWYDLYEYTCYYSCDLHTPSPLRSSRFCLELWTIHNAWPMTQPLHISMILHDLLSKLKTSVYRCMLLSPGSCDIPAHDMAGATNSTARKVREKILQLAMPHWMWVLRSSWGGRTFMS